MFYLLADSTALFKPSSPCLMHLSKQLGNDAKFAYIGAANADQAEYFELFCAAIATLKPASVTHVQYPFSNQSLEPLAEADAVVLAGGDVEQGWLKLSDHAFQHHCAALKARNIVWIGISAGAVHLGAGFFNYVPWFIGAHEEANAWQQTKQAYVELGFDKHNIACLGLKTSAAIHISANTFLIENLSGQIEWVRT